ncbi:MAG: hypothetical protein Q8O19_02755, partial [Rectinemataceae bacterium]|nr:hypothetical protein [Rectinemataceae bacterium]
MLARRVIFKKSPTWLELEAKPRCRAIAIQTRTGLNGTGSGVSWAGRASVFMHLVSRIGFARFICAYFAPRKISPRRRRVSQ